MKTMAGTISESLEVLQPKEAAKNNEASAELGRSVEAALKTFSTTHRGSARQYSAQGENQSNENLFLNQVKQIGVGLTFTIFPMLFIFAFAIHPGLLQPHLLSPEELILRAHGNGLLQFGHVLVTLNTALLIVVALHFMKLLDRSSGAWAGFIGAAIAILGAIILAADKGALCLTMSAFDTLPEEVFAQIMPGILAMFTKQGWLVLLWGMVFLPIGFAIQAVGLHKTKTLPRWQSILFLIGVLLVAIPDGLEIINLSASILMAIALVPYGIRIIVKALDS